MPTTPSHGSPRFRLRDRGAVPALAASALLAALFALAPWRAAAETLSSPSFELLGAHPASVSRARVAFATSLPRLGSTGYSLGQLSAVGFVGAQSTLQVAALGFWPIVAGGFPNIDTDADGIASPFDLDDDGDGLPDTVESNRGVFLSQSDTGSSPVDADSDGDGFDDRLEVDLGSDPNDPLSIPSAAVPALGGAAVLILCSLLIWIGSAWRRTRTEYA